jgi:hypothetical protein
MIISVSRPGASQQDGHHQEGRQEGRRDWP